MLTCWMLMLRSACWLIVRQCQHSQGQKANPGNCRLLLPAAHFEKAGVNFVRFAHSLDADALISMLTNSTSVPNTLKVKKQILIWKLIEGYTANWNCQLLTWKGWGWLAKQVHSPDLTIARSKSNSILPTATGYCLLEECWGWLPQQVHSPDPAVPYSKCKTSVN